MISPKIAHWWDQERCGFHVPNDFVGGVEATKGYEFDPKHFLMEGEGITHVSTVEAGATSEGSPEVRKYKGKIAIRHLSEWTCIDVEITGTNILIYWEVFIGCEPLHDPTDIAIPIDKNITEIDVNGASGIYLNAEGTAWLFKHAEREDHHDREIITESVIESLFAEHENKMTQAVIALIIRDTGSSRELGDLSTVAHLTDFKHDCMDYARERERTLYLGQHRHYPEDYAIHKMALKAIEEVKKIWNATKENELNSIINQVNAVESRLRNRHGYQTRWDKAAKAKQSASQNEE